MGYIKLGTITYYGDLIVDDSTIATTQLARILTNNVTKYLPSNSYKTNDLCYYEGHIYRALNNTQNILPTNTISWLRITLDINEFQELSASVGNKVDKVNGKDLSTNDFTNDYKTKLDNLDSNLSNKVNKDGNKVLSTNDFTNLEKAKLSGLLNYNDTLVRTLISNKVDKDGNKVLSTNDFTDAYKTKLLSLLNYDDSEVIELIETKVDKDGNKVLSTNDFTNLEKAKLSGLLNYNDSLVRALISNKVDKDGNKVLSTNDFTNDNKEKLERLLNYDDTEIFLLLELKQDKITEDNKLSFDLIEGSLDVNEIRQSLSTKENPNDKILSTNDFTDNDKERLDNLLNYDDTLLKTLINTKIDKDGNKVLSTNDFTNLEKTKLSGLLNYNDTELRTLISNKVDKDGNKVLSTNDFTNGYKTKLDNLNSNLSNKVDKDGNKVLSDNNYTTTEKNKLASLTNYDDTSIKQSLSSKADLVSGKLASSQLPLGETSTTAFPGNRGLTLEQNLANKVDKVTGKGLSTNDFTTAYKTKLDGLNTFENDPTVPSWVKSDSPPQYTYEDVGAAPATRVDRILEHEPGLYYANYNTGDYQLLSLSAGVAATLVVVNIPQEEFMIIFVRNEGGSLVFGDTEILSSGNVGDYFLVFGNPTGSEILYINGDDGEFSGGGGTAYDDTELRNLISNKVDKVSGKGLSTNDFTATYKSKLDNLDTNLNNKTNIVKLGSITSASGTYTANYSTADYHRITLTGATTILVTNIPLGDFLLVHVDNTNGFTLTFGTTEILSNTHTGSYHILFGNPKGTIVNIGTPSSDEGDRLAPGVGGGSGGGSSPTYQTLSNTGSVSLSVSPNYIYKYTSSITGLSLSLSSDWSATSPETVIEFNTSTSFSGVTLPTTVKWTVPTPTFAVSKRYLLVIWGGTIATATEVNK